MPTATPTTEPRRLSPTSGCGTLESPWTGWERSLEAPGAEPRTFVAEAGFYAVSRCVRLPDDTTVTGDSGPDGRAWFLPAPGARVEALFRIDAASGVRIEGLCLNGRGRGARHGVLIRGGSGLHVDDCRFEDFSDPDGAALCVAGVDADRPARETVVRRCHFLNGACGLRLGRDTSDLLVADNRFEEISGAATLIDPGDQWADYGLIFVENRIRARRAARTDAFLSVRPGAEGIRIAENTIEAEGTAAASDRPGVEIRGGGPWSRRRVELLLNRIVGTGGPGIRARQCGPGFVAAGNALVTCGASERGAVDLVGCHGVLVEDNEVHGPAGHGIRIQDCAASRFNGNEVTGGSPAQPRGGSVGLLVEGDGTRRIRLTDNRVSAVRDDGLCIRWSAGVRVVGNEVEDCGGGIRVERAENLLLVGNDCRDNAQGGIRIGPDVRRGLVALNYAILNGATDLEVRGERIRCRSNKVDQRSLPVSAHDE